MTETEIKLNDKDNSTNNEYAEKILAMEEKVIHLEKDNNELKLENSLNEKNHLKFKQKYNDIKVKNNKLHSVIINKDTQILTFNDKFNELYDI